jgi:hypothetical protein
MTEANSRLSQFCDKRLKIEFIRLVSFGVPCGQPVNLANCYRSRHTLPRAAGQLVERQRKTTLETDNNKLVNLMAFTPNKYRLGGYLTTPADNHTKIN